MRCHFLIYFICKLSYSMGLLYTSKHQNISSYTRFRTLLSLDPNSTWRPFRCSFSWALLIFCWLSTFVWSTKQICLVVKHASWDVVDILFNHLGCYENGFIKLCSLNFPIFKKIHIQIRETLDDYYNFKIRFTCVYMLY